eukprot:965129-Amphidinium_carterae.1
MCLGTSPSCAGRTSHGDSEALGLVSDWPHSKLRLCQQKSSDVYYGTLGMTVFPMLFKSTQLTRHLSNAFCL